MVGHCVVAWDLNGDIFELDASAWASTAALKLTKDSTGGGASPVGDSNVMDVKLAGVAFAGSLVIACALSDRKDTGGVVELEVGHSNVGCIAETSSTTVRWIAAAYTSPCFEISCVAHAIVDGDIANSDVLDVFKFAIVLTDAAHSEAKTSVPVLVLDEDVGTVGLCRDVVIAAINYPVAEGDIVRVNDIGTISVERREVEANLLLCVCAVDIHVFEQDILRVNDSHGPHLALHESCFLDDTVLHALKRDLMRSPREIIFAINFVVPNLSIAIECAIPEAVPMDVLAAKYPSSGLVLETDWQRVVEPVVDVSVPKKGAMDFNVDVGQASGVHDTANIVGLVLLEDDFAAVLSSFMTTGAECLYNGMRAIIGTGIDHAGLGAASVVVGSAVVGKGQGWKAKRGNELLVHLGCA